MKNKKWTLEEAKKDFKKPKMKRNCSNCKFSFISSYDGTFCNIKEEWIICECINAILCKYFTYKD